MTEKKETILQTALQLFADQGYENTPTSQIARVAGVSEGLIFRHFENKEGLFKAILDEGQARLQQYVDRIEREPDPKKRIGLVIDLGPTLVQEERLFWQLQFTLKFKTTLYAKLKQEQESFQALFQAGVEAFAALGYAQPEQEIYLLMLLLEGLTSQLLVQPAGLDVSATTAFIKSKYGV
jgi:AcrR family transcriptional regulator